MSHSSQNPDAHSHAHRPASERAAAFCERRGVAFTPIRRRVLEELGASKTPLSAYELTDRVRGAKRIAPVQVYRALEFLLEAGVIHRLATKSAYLICNHEHSHDETVMFLVCADCGAVEEATSAEVGQGLKQAARLSRFKTAHPVVEIEGRCAMCQQVI